MKGDFDPTPIFEAVYVGLIVGAVLYVLWASYGRVWP